MRVGMISGELSARPFLKRRLVCIGELWGESESSLSDIVMLE